MENNNTIEKICFGGAKGNSLTIKDLTDLSQKIQKAAANTSSNVILLESVGDRVFCAGANFQELLAVENKEQGAVFFSGFAKVILAMRDCKKPIIGCITGKAVGGGLGIIASCDYAIADSNAAVKLSELAIGIGPFVIAPAVARKIGENALAQLSLQPKKWQNAHWAQEKGLYQEVYNTPEQTQKAALEKALELASYNPQGLLEMKKIFWQNTQHWDTLLYERAAISGDLVLSAFTKNALKAFK